MPQPKKRSPASKPRRTKDLAPRSAGKVKAGFIPGAGVITNSISAAKKP
jgi:hypothetical protein